ncbi:MAG: bi-domain-containing oxidoreductase [Vicinamibacterales bacterium]|nr:bi-domain-containing oxidoreductase [Vicinamibacterales bacterium]
MRQVLLNSHGAVVARVPRPTVEPGTVLVRVHYSLISVGTEIAPLRSTLTAPDVTSVEKGMAYASLAQHYFRASLRDPRKAASRLKQIARRQIAAMRPPETPAPVPAVALGRAEWTKASETATLTATGDRVEVVTDSTPAGYQVMSQVFAVPEGQVALVRVRGTIEGGPIAIGLLNDARDRWLLTRTYEPGDFEDQLVCEAGASPQITVVVTTASAGRPVRVALDRAEVALAPPTVGGLPHSELNDTGWNVGYSVAGEVVAVGQGITDLAPGDLVACAGAGQANHADYVVVRRNLVARLPKGCPVDMAASTTIGAIALQGVRRAAPELGDRIAVVGLGLIGQITVQLLKANGCKVIGLDLDPGRVARARERGMDAGASDPAEFLGLVRDLTGGQGADRTILTAATKSDAVINLGMDVTRRRGAVIIVGDVSLNVKREVFYRKEIDLLMSTSYGPGRYDASYEVEGRDYPYAYVRWTQNRNMQAYLELVASGQLQIQPLIDRVISIDETPSAYKELAKGGQALPMGVLIRYPDDARDLPEALDAPRITIRGHRPPPDGVINYALVGAGGFGTGMLVPQMKKRRDRFFLRGVVSRGSAASGNFAREHQVEVLTTDYGAILADPGFHLVVLATRHDKHADQVVRGLEAGKHVFVEKPLALSWEELDRVVGTYRGLEQPPLLLVGFNRRFSPAVQAIKAATANRRAPLVVNYRLHAGYLPPDHWVHGPEGGGRNVGEACHMYDVFRCLTGAPVQSVTATAIDPGTLPYFRNDNFAATIGYADGSVCTLTYTSLGPKQGLGKEYIEVFSDGEAYIVDDFKKLTKTSDQSVLWQSSEADKGHRDELSQFGDAIAAGAPSPIPFDELVETSALALRIEDLLHGRIDDGEGA